MKLSFKERNQIRKMVGDKLKALEEQGLSFKQRNAIRKENGELLRKLNEKLEQNIDNEKLMDLIAGKFNDLEPEKFLKVLKDIVTEIGDVEPVKEPTVKYVEVRAKDNPELIAEAANAILEAARGNAFPARDKKKVNEILHRYSQQRYRNIPIDDIFDEIIRLGYVPLQEDGTEWSGMLAGAKGRASIPMAKKQEPHNSNTVYPESDWFKQYLQIQWYRDKNNPGANYEFNAYVM